MDIYLEHKHPPLICSLMKGWLPESGKRMIFTTALVCRIAHNYGVSTVDLEKIKQIFTLSPPLRSMVFPALIHGKIWKGLKTTDPDGQPLEPEAIKATVLETCPSWLAYGEAADRSRDVEAVLKFIKQNVIPEVA